MSDLIEFYGTECPHCVDMVPLIERLKKETGLKIDRFEVWHNAGHAGMMEKLDKNFCGGVPFFFNKRTNKWICGATSYERLKAWAMGK